MPCLLCQSWKRFSLFLSGVPWTAVVERLLMLLVVVAEWPNAVLPNRLDWPAVVE